MAAMLIIYFCFYFSLYFLINKKIKRIDLLICVFLLYLNLLRMQEYLIANLYYFVNRGGLVKIRGKL